MDKKQVLEKVLQHMTEAQENIVKANEYLEQLENDGGSLGALKMFYEDMVIKHDNFRDWAEELLKKDEK